MHQLIQILCSSLFEQLPAVEQVCELNTAMAESTEVCLAYFTERVKINTAPGCNRDTGITSS